MTIKQNPALLLDSARGFYIPKNFVEQFDMTKWEGISAEDIEILKAGDNFDTNPSFWETWDSVLGNASYTDPQGRKWLLYQDGDLWAYHADSMDNETYERFFGETKPAPDDALEFEFCSTCVMGLVNEDYSGMSDEEEAATQEGLERLSKQYGGLTFDGANLGFTHRECECCGALAGDRYRVLVLEKDQRK